MKNSTLIHNVTHEEITRLFKSLENQITELKQNFQPLQPPEYMTRSEVRDMLKINMATLHNWCKSNKLKPLGIGNRVYFLRADVLSAIKPIK
jgi:hypothetical protein